MKNTNLIFVIMVAVWLIAMSLSAIKALSADGVVYVLNGADVTLSFEIKPQPTIVEDIVIPENSLLESEGHTQRSIWL
jgi:hypothetical protein